MDSKEKWKWNRNNPFEKRQKYFKELIQEKKRVFAVIFSTTLSWLGNDKASSKKYGVSK